MDDERIASAPDDDPQDDAAFEDRAADDAPQTDDAPDDDRDDGGDEGEPGAEPEDDPKEELSRLRQELQERERSDRERAERDAQERSRQQQLQAQQGEQQKQFARQQAWNAYQSAKARIAQQRLEDFETARASDDPQTVWRFLNEQRDREAQSEDWRYNQWTAQDRHAELVTTQQALERASTREYADYVRDAYGLPHDALADILNYSDGSPVHHTAFASRAAEIKDRRAEQARHNRQIKRLQREQGRDDVRGRTGYAPGSGRGGASVPSGEPEGTIDELRQFFPMGRERVRERRAG